MQVEGDNCRFACRLGYEEAHEAPSRKAVLHKSNLSQVYQCSRRPAMFWVIVSIRKKL
jgi:hypothetical protein